MTPHPLQGPLSFFTIPHPSLEDACDDAVIEVDGRAIPNESPRRAL